MITGWNLLDTQVNQREIKRLPQNELHLLPVTASPSHIWFLTFPLPILTTSVFLPLCRCLLLPILFPLSSFSPVSSVVGNRVALKAGSFYSSSTRYIHFSYCKPGGGPSLSGPGIWALVTPSRLAPGTTWDWGSRQAMGTFILFVG